MKKTGRELCDNAPVVKISLGTEPRDVTMIVPYYENPNFLVDQIIHWQGRYDGVLSKHLKIILVDDGSPVRPAEQVFKIHWPVDSVIALEHFCIDVDVRWNWLAARNIGARHAITDWIMLTDIDHVLIPETLRTLVFGKFDQGTIYRFSRREHTGEEIHPHPNSFFMFRDMYWKIGGYDEALSGYYGTDGLYRRRCAETAPIRIMKDELVRYEKIGDSSTIRYLRKQPEDAEAKRIARSFKPGHKPRLFSFPYHKVDL